MPPKKDKENTALRPGKRRATETALEMAQRHVTEGHKRVERQQQVVREMDLHRHPEAAKRARETLALFEENLRLAIEHLQIERARYRPR